MEYLNEAKKVTKELSKRFNKKEQLIEYMIEILKREKYNLNEMKKIMIEFLTNY